MCLCLLLCVCVCVNVLTCASCAADVWSDGDLPPGWREVTDVSEVYFWHIPTGTTQYDRPVAQGNEHTHPNSDSHLDTLRPPNEVRLLLTQATSCCVWLILTYTQHI